MAWQRIIGRGRDKQGRKLLENSKGYLVITAFLLAIAALPANAQDSVPEAPSVPKPAAVEQAQRGLGGGGERFGSNVVSYWYGPYYRTPFVLTSTTGQAADIQRNALEYSHLSFWTFGSNFADLMLNQSSMAEPASNGGSGATELYATLRSDLGLNEATHTKTFQKGPLRDISIELGANLETKNSSFAPSERTLYFGPKLQMALPRGYFNVGLHLRKEWNHEGVLGKSESYDPDFNIEPTWMLPFKVGKMYLAYSGFAEYNTQKGKDSFGTQMVPEFLLRNFLTVDVGGLLFHKPQVVDLNCGFWYWHNEYGKPSSDTGAKQMTPMFGLALHLDGVRQHRSH
jgi:hypothetical protein